MEENSAGTEKRSWRKDDFTDLLFSWSLKDIFDEDLYKHQVCEFLQLRIMNFDFFERIQLCMEYVFNMSWFLTQLVQTFELALFGFILIGQCLVKEMWSLALLNIVINEKA